MLKKTVGNDALWGALAGAVATVALDKVTGALYERESRVDRFRENWARGGKSATEIAASRIAEASGSSLSREAESAAGHALHYALGIGAGALYGVLRRRMPAVRAGRGLLYGAAFWLVADEIAVPAAGLTPGPRAFPLATHARALLGHLAFGLAADAALSAADLARSAASAPDDPRRAEFAARLDAAGGPLARKLTVG